MNFLHNMVKKNIINGEHYNYLNSETLMKEKTVIELPLWEKYLIYATAFGIADKVVKALEIKHPDTNASEIINNN